MFNREILARIIRHRMLMQLRKVVAVKSRRTRCLVCSNNHGVVSANVNYDDEMKIVREEVSCFLVIGADDLNNE